MATKKAAKKSAKKAAKKAAKKSAKHHGGSELRRAYEHLGRLEVLQGGLPGPVITEINALTAMARGNPQATRKRRLATICGMRSMGSMST